MVDGVMESGYDESGPIVGFWFLFGIILGMSMDMDAYERVNGL
jgi:hypothetical protein